MRLTAEEIAEATSGELIGNPSAIADSYGIDTRRLDPGGCFVALRGERDGNDYVADAWKRDATIAVVNRPPGRVRKDRAAVLVPDSLVALGSLGDFARHRLPDTTVVGITGSAGKTATKDLLAAALDATHRVHASPASFNNEAGVPLTLLAAPEDAEVIVTEMGARFAGNITELCTIAEPQVGVITHVGMAHAGLLGGREGIARVKGELLEALDGDGTAVLDAGDDFTPMLAARTRAKVLTVGLGDAPGADVRVLDLVLDDELRPSFVLETPWGTTSVCLSVRGEHQAANAAMAATVALDLGAPVDRVAEGLARATTAAWRMDITRTPGGITVVNDAYNASPTSMAAALRSFRHLASGKRRLAVLGEMLELGDHSRAEHEAIGRLAVESDVDVVIAVGAAAQPIADGARGAGAGGAQVIEVDGADGALAAVTEHARKGDAVLVKASRAVGLERVAEALTSAVGT
jgi:UDP-N-acetylmuramoyl-tripeptide--D-alanyl-D-alanine ligase